MSNRKLIVISHDAMVKEDLEFLSDKPGFSWLEGGAAVPELRTIYPSITYPVHVSISTGDYPARHGVVNNEIYEIGKRGSPWNWFAQACRAKTIFAAAKEAGLTTASVFWPVTGCCPDIDYLIDEYWTQSPDDTCESAFARSGSSPEVMEEIVKPNLDMLRGHERRHPEADEFVIKCACDIIERYKPDLLMVHPANIDAARHGYGLFNSHVDGSLLDAARWTQAIIDATVRAGTFEQTSFVAMSDHGQMEIKRVVCLNAILADEGLLRVGEDGQIADWEAYVQSSGMSAQVYLKNPSNRALELKVGALLRSLRDEGIYGIGEVFTREQAYEREHLYGGFSFVVETDGYTSFSNDWKHPIGRNLDTSDYRFGRATHGYLPDRGPQPTLIARGPAFRDGAVSERRPIVDVTPTLAAALGFEMPGIDGKPIDDILAR